MEFENRRQVWSEVVRCIAPAETAAAQQVLQGSDDPSDEMRWALEEAGLCIYVDWRSGPDDIRSWFEIMVNFPSRFTWDWYTEFVGDSLLDWDSRNDTVRLLEEIGERCFDIGSALVSSELDADGWALIVVDTARVDELLELTARADTRFQVLRRGERARGGVAATANRALRLMDLLTRRLSRAMVQDGYVVTPTPLNGEPAQLFEGTQLRARRLWFIAPAAEVAGMTAAIEAWLTRQGGQVSIRGSAWVGSVTAGEFLAAVSQQNLRGDDEFDSVPFGFFDNPQIPFRALALSTDDDLDYIVDKFMTYVRGPAARWLAVRDSLDKLYDLAKTCDPMNSGDVINPEPTRLRAVAILGIENGRPDASAALLRWYSARRKFAPRDSAELVAAFDSALTQRYPAYGRASHLTDPDRPAVIGAAIGAQRARPDLRVDLGHAVEIARVAAGFDWTWTLADLEPFCALLDWQIDSVTEQSASLTTNLVIEYPEADFHVGRHRTIMDWLRVQLTDIATGEGSAAFVIDAFTELAEHISAELGPPFRGDPDGTSSVCWRRRNVVITLVPMGETSVCLRVGSPELEEWLNTPEDEARWFF